MSSKKNKVQLDTLRDSGNLTVSFPLGDTETAGSDGFGALFDISFIDSTAVTNTKLEISTPGSFGTGNGYAQLRIDFSTPLPSGDYSSFIFCDHLDSSDGISLTAYDENDTAFYNSGFIDVDPHDISPALQQSTHDFTVPSGKTLSYFILFIKMTGTPAQIFDFDLTFSPPEKRIDYKNFIKNSKPPSLQQDISDSNISIIPEEGEFKGDGFYLNNQTYAPKQAVDNSNQTQFISKTNNGAGRYGLEIDLEAETGDAQLVDYVRVRVGNNTWGSWRLDYSLDGVSFITGEDNSLSQYGSDPNDGGPPHYLYIDHSLPIKKLRFSRTDTLGDATFFVRIFEFQVYLPGNPEPVNFDFNDTVLTTKAWNSSRYDGRQLSAKKLNKVSRDDVGNNNKTPIIRNYTRNIYLGNEIVGMNETGPEDPTLVQFPDFSYAQITSFITVNEDGSLTRNTLDPEENNDNQKKAFYRPFIYDFPEGSFCNFILGDPTVKNNLKSKYPIYFNGGQLKKLLTLQPRTIDEVSIPTFDSGRFNGGFISSKRFDSSLNSISGACGVLDVIESPPEFLPNTQQGALYIGGLAGEVISIEAGDAADVRYVTASGMKAKLDNEDIYRTWYTGSVSYETSFLSGLEAAEIGPGADLVELVKFSQNLLDYKSNSPYKGDKRFFITVAKYHNPTYFDEPIQQGNPKPLYTFEPNSIHTASLGINDINLSSLTTLEVNEVNSIDASLLEIDHTIIEFAFNPNLSTVYIDSSTYHQNESQGAGRRLQYALTRGKSFVPNALTGSFMFSVTDDDIPSLLIPLKKEKDLQNGKGEKPFVVIPENLHPYVKDNLIFYLSKAGIDIGGDATNKVEENLDKKPRTSKLSPRERRLLALERLQQSLERRKTIETARRDRRRAITRREDREERRKRRVENRQERRKNRKDRKENRQENRQERRKNRKNRRRRR